MKKERIVATGSRLGGCGIAAGVQSIATLGLFWTQAEDTHEITSKYPKGKVVKFKRVI